MDVLFAAHPHSHKEPLMTSLRQRMTEDMQVRNLALNTQSSYLQQVSQFARYFKRSPEQLGPEEIRAYQIYLTNERKLAPGSVLIAVAALRFLYKVSLKRKWSFDEVIPDNLDQGLSPTLPGTHWPLVDPLSALPKRPDGNR